MVITSYSFHLWPLSCAAVTSVGQKHVTVILLLFLVLASLDGRQRHITSEDDDDVCQYGSAHLSSLNF